MKQAALLMLLAFASTASADTRPSNVKLNATSSEYIGPIYSKHSTTGWAVLTDPTYIARSREIIRIAGRFNGGLKLENVTGSSHVTMVNIAFADGTSQTLKLDHTLTGRQAVQLAVRRGELDYIVVYGTTAAGGTYRVLGY